MTHFSELAFRYPLFPVRADPDHFIACPGPNLWQCCAIIIQQNGLSTPKENISQKGMSVHLRSDRPCWPSGPTRGSADHLTEQRDFPRPATPLPQARGKTLERPSARQAHCMTSLPCIGRVQTVCMWIDRPGPSSPGRQLLGRGLTDRTGRAGRPSLPSRHTWHWGFQNGRRPISCYFHRALSRSPHATEPVHWH